MPICVFVAGPNGCGKSTLTSSFTKSPVVLDPDKFALEHNSLIAGGRAIIRKFNELISQSRSVVIETTLSGKAALNQMRAAKKAGYKVEFHYVSVARIDIAIYRVMERVARGGHDVPLKDQKRRFSRSFENAVIAVSIADESYIYDNSTNSGHTLIVSYRKTERAKFHSRMPIWCKKFVLRCNATYF